MADLPSDLFTKIFSHLPVQSLLRFRSTSKSLKSLIDSHNFTNLHLKNSLDFNLILRHNSNLYQLDFPNLTVTIPLNHPFTHDDTNISLLNSYNGLLCISNGVKEIAFWNPNIRSKYCILPYLPITSYSEDQIILFDGHGFVFYRFTGDYKFVKISSLIDLQHETFHSQVRIFSWKTNSWKVLPSTPDIIESIQTMGVLVENSLHWVVTFPHCVMLAFNITQEIFNEVPLPEIKVANNDLFTIDVSLLGKCLCITVSNYHTNKVDVWVMKEYGLKDSWCKLFTLEESRFYTLLISLKPLGYSSNRSKVLLEVNHEKLFWYDLESEKVTFVQGIPNFNEAIIYVGSLVPPIDNSNYRKQA